MRGRPGGPGPRSVTVTAMSACFTRCPMPSRCCGWWTRRERTSTTCSASGWRRPRRSSSPSPPPCAWIRDGCRSKSSSDSAAFEIVRRAEERGADLAVVGSHGRGVIRRFLLGSVAERVLREAGCPVMIVPDRALRATAMEGLTLRAAGATPGRRLVSPPGFGARSRHEVPDRGEVAAQLPPEVGVRDRGQRLAALAQREPVQVHRAVLGDDPVHVAARRDHAGARSSAPSRCATPCRRPPSRAAR